MNSAFWISNLTLTNFRSYDHLKLEFDPSPVVITGPNGSGKTNILEAVSLLASGRGLRMARLSEIDKRQKSDSPYNVFGWAINAAVNLGENQTVISTARETSRDNIDKRIIKIDGEIKRNSSALESAFSLIYFVPQMNHIFTEGRRTRLAFLDRLTMLFDYGHPKRLGVYEKYSAERRRLLKENPDEIWLSATESTMAEQAVAIAASRLEALEYIGKALAEFDSRFPRARMEVKGLVEDNFPKMPALQLEEFFKAKLEEARKLDFFSGRTNYGVHRSDFSVVYAENGALAENCSTGEQKALLLSIILGAARAKATWFNAAPVVLLDEIVAHLDDERREELFGQIASLGIQAWMTATHPKFFKNFAGKMQFFSVHDSVIC